MSYMFRIMLRLIFNFLTFGFILLIIAFLGFLVVREWFYWQGISKFRASAVSLRNLSTQDCGVKDQEGNVTPLPAIKQLRFSSPTAYFVEVSCPDLQTEPVLSNPHALVAFMSKKQGPAGFIANPEIPEQVIILSVFENVPGLLPEKFRFLVSWVPKEVAIVMKNGVQIEEKPVGEVRLSKDLGPISQCEGYGFTCCNALSEVGTGTAIEGLPACDGRCYEKCLSRPVLLSLETNPFSEWSAREVRLNKGATLEVAYVAEDAGKQGPWVATVSFGDGQSQTGQGLEGSFSHTYNCATESCEYILGVTVTNALGATSVLSPIAQMKVIVR